LGYILLVEDDTRLARTYKRVLRGSRLVWTATAEEALTLIETEPDIAVLLCDLNLQAGAMQGKDMLEEVEYRWPELLQRTYVMSGHAEEDVAHLFSSTVRYIHKPVGIAELRAAVNAFNPDPDPPA